MLSVTIDSLIWGKAGKAYYVRVRALLILNANVRGVWGEGVGGGGAGGGGGGAGGGGMGE